MAVSGYFLCFFCPPDCLAVQLAFHLLVAVVLGWFQQYCRRFILMHVSSRFIFECVLCFSLGIGIYVMVFCVYFVVLFGCHYQCKRFT